ncbi:MAG: hypothetical protein OEY07_03310 [Gammaproteobacteria bacterium]|nr:hypothetical protein [Gammaproteobacteria bacterium]
MKMVYLLMLLPAMLMGCSDKELAYIDVPKTELKNYGVDPLYHTQYLGSDRDFHYFVWMRGKARGGWKVKKSTLPFQREFPFGTGRRFVKTDKQGNIVPMDE